MTKTLHIIQTQQIENILTNIDSVDSILLLSSAVNALADKGLQQITNINQYKLFALHEDIKLRGLEKQLNLSAKLSVKLIDYDEFVELTATHKPIVTWN